LIRKNEHFFKLSKKKQTATYKTRKSIHFLRAYEIINL